MSSPLAKSMIASVPWLRPKTKASGSIVPWSVLSPEASVITLLSATIAS